MIEKKNITITKSGLKMETLVEGHGPTAIEGNTVKIHYILYLGPGTSSSDYDYDNKCYVDELVDSTYEEAPFSGPIKIIVGTETPKDTVYSKGESVRGLSEALTTMSIGSKKRLHIPPDLAYGSEGASSFHTFHGYRTPPDRTLDMIVELIEIQDNKSE